MDNYTEQILESKTPTKYALFFSGGLACMITGIFVFMAVNVIIGFVLFIAGIVFFNIGKGAQNIEYEYLFVNGDFEVAMIKNKARRKKVCDVNDSDIIKILPYESDKGKNELDINSRLTQKDFTSGCKDKSESWFIFFVNRKNATDAVILELNEKSLEHCKNAYKKKLELKK